MAKILVTMPDSFLSRVDKFASNEKLNRSEYIREALQNYMVKTSILNNKKAIKDAQSLEQLIG